MSNTQENYMNKANATAIINKLETKLNNRYTKDEVDELIESTSGGHTIENASGTALTQRDTLQFKGGLSVSDDSTNEVTVVDDTIPIIEWSVWNAMTPQEQEAIPNALILNAPDSGGGSGIEWITKEQWDAMTPEQQSNGTYGVQGLGKGGDSVNTRIDISSYNSSSNKYITPSDGYFSIVCSASGQYARGILYNSHLGVSTGHNGTFAQSQTYVKKGCDIWVTDVTGSPEIYFFPLS